jgi:DNA-binding response OmpR family regulator
MLNGISGNLPSLIFLDLRMPRLSGKKCLIELKKNEATKDIPVIIYTTSRSLLESAELKQLGAAHFITKPTNPEEIYFLLSMVLEENEKLLPG